MDIQLHPADSCYFPLVPPKGLVQPQESLESVVWILTTGNGTLISHYQLYQRISKEKKPFGIPEFVAIILVNIPFGSAVILPFLPQRRPGNNLEQPMVPLYLLVARSELGPLINYITYFRPYEISKKEPNDLLIETSQTKTAQGIISLAKRYISSGRSLTIHHFALTQSYLQQPFNETYSKEALEYISRFFIDKSLQWRIKEVFQCNSYPKEFSAECYLRQHIQSSHEKKPFQCNSCPKGYYLKDSLRKHIQRSHEKKSFQCNSCPKGYYLRGSLRQHIQSSHERKVFQCNSCSKEFPAKRYLRQHVQFRHEEKVFQCNSCPRKYSREKYLRQHIQCYHGEKVFQFLPSACDRAVEAKLILFSIFFQKVGETRGKGNHNLLAAHEELILASDYIDQLSLSIDCKTQRFKQPLQQGPKPLTALGVEASHPPALPSVRYTPENPVIENQRQVLREMLSWVEEDWELELQRIENWTDYYLAMHGYLQSIPQFKDDGLQEGEVGKQHRSLAAGIQSISANAVIQPANPKNERFSALQNLIMLCAGIGWFAALPKAMGILRLMVNDDTILTTHKYVKA
ncbi:hypothetical protein TEQG_03091 [Trichophyton equinum CBS 127.97]|uniref:C2H2-type domain-containing protein n=1 Tax=Trichophyton equinum (strain ATCC MYA-4606 / CBS 127.97) TaxID=559882 RepID=F2PQ91_TRIEC|nr:hypothetical protein TEQG_03091 [Trichophyton equinum CBS 127.97]